MGLNLAFFSKCKIHIDLQHLLKLSSSTECGNVMFSTNVDYLCEFWIFEKLLNLAHEKLVNILGGHGIGINIH